MWTFIEVEKTHVIKNSVGNVLNDGDTVTVIKDLKGSYSSIKDWINFKNITLLLYNRHERNIDYKIYGFRAMKLKSEVVKKA